MIRFFNHNNHVLYPKLLLSKIHLMDTFHLFLKTMTLAHHTAVSEFGPLAHLISQMLYPLFVLEHYHVT